MITKRRALSHCLALTFVGAAACITHAAVVIPSPYLPPPGFVAPAPQVSDAARPGSYEGELCDLFLKASTALSRDGVIFRLRILGVEAQSQLTVLKSGAVDEAAFQSYQRELRRELAHYDAVNASLAPMALALMTNPQGVKTVRLVNYLADSLRALAVMSPAEAKSMDQMGLASFSFTNYVPAAIYTESRKSMMRHASENHIYRRTFEELNQVVSALESGAPGAIAADFRKILSAVRSAKITARSLQQRHLESCVESTARASNAEAVMNCLSLEAMAVVGTLMSERLAWTGAVVLMARLWNHGADGPLFMSLARQAIVASQSSSITTPWAVGALGVYSRFMSHIKGQRPSARIALSAEALLGRRGLAGILMSGLLAERLPAYLEGALLTEAVSPEGAFRVSADEGGVPSGLLLRRGQELLRSDELLWTAIGFVHPNAVILRSELGAAQVATLEELQNCPVLGSALLR